MPTTSQCRAAYRAIRNEAIATHSKPFCAADFDVIVRAMVAPTARPIAWVQAAIEYTDLLAVSQSK